jgi:hypothetical protein
MLLVKKRKGQTEPDCEKKCVDFPTLFYLLRSVYSYLVVEWIANTDKLRALSETGLAIFKPQEDRIIPKNLSPGPHISKRRAGLLGAALRTMGYGSYILSLLRKLPYYVLKFCH